MANPRGGVDDHQAGDRLAEDLVSRSVIDYVQAALRRSIVASSSRSSRPRHVRTDLPALGHHGRDVAAETIVGTHDG
jgi:hypothetical protein